MVDILYTRMNIEILNQLNLPQDRDYGRMKKIRGDKPIRIIIHIHMDITKKLPV
jgi:hypothetical protein